MRSASIDEHRGRTPTQTGALRTTGYQTTHVVRASEQAALVAFSSARPPRKSVSAAWAKHQRGRS
jgi:hypothetical protein